MGFGIKKEAGSNSTPSEIVNFDKLTPTTAGVVFDPNTPATEDILYLSSVDASTWIWNGTAYVTYSNTTASTEWYLLGTTIDAGSNKTAAISRNAGVYTQGSDSYFNSVRVGRGAQSILTNTVVGNGSGGSISTGFYNTFNGYQSGQNVSTGTRNSFFGYFSGRSNTTAGSNTFIGNYSGYSNTTAQYNTFVGSDSGLSNTTANYNTFIGSGCGFLNTTAQWNTFLGHFSGHFNTTGQKNTFLGSSSGQENTTGAENTFSGYYSGYFNTTGAYNTFSGSSSGFSNSTGAENTFIGALSGYNNTTASYNVFIGTSSGKNNTNGERNLFIGTNSGFSNTTGNRNIFLGINTGYSHTVGNYNSFIGDQSGFSTTSGSNNTFFGNASGYYNITGENNTFSGSSSGFSNTSGSANNFLGANAGYSNTTGNNNTFFGSDSGLNNTTAQYNLFIGNSSGKSNTTGENNTFVGTSCGFNNITGGNNTFLGTNSGRYIIGGTTPLTISSNSVFLGNDTKALADNQTNQIVIGYNTIGKGSNTVNIGNTSVTDSYINGIPHIADTWVLPTTAPTTGQVLGYSSAGVSNWVLAGSSVPQANTIYVDSINGINATTGRGDINTPYLTPEYALGNITNTGTVTATTTSTSATLTAVSDTTNIQIGQYITGTGIPYGSIVVSKTSNTIVLSKSCTASATITATWWTVYEVVLSGSFVATGSWQKQGFIFDCCNSTISWGAFTLFNVTTAQLVPFSVIGGNWNGTSSSSKFLSLIAGSANFIFKPNTFYSIGTSYSIDSNQNGQYKFNNFTLECPNYICAFGSIASFESIGAVNVNGYFYGLLQGFLLRYCTFNSFGQIETPSSVNAINNTQDTTFNVNSVIKGSVSSSATGGGSFNGNITGTTVLSTASLNAPANYNANVNVNTFTNSGHAIINGQLGGNLINNAAGGNIIVNDMFKNYTGSSSSKATIRATSNSGFTFNATLTGTSELTVLDTRFSINSVTTYSIAAGCTLYNKGYFNGGIALSGTLINDGNMIIGGIPIISGLLINNNVIELIGTDPSLSISTGTYQQNGGKLICNVVASKSGLLRKTATGGKIQLIGQAYLKVANGLAPIQILSNVGTSQNVEVYSVVDNCAAGFRISNTFSDTTYGTTYAPNILVGGTMLEDITYLL